MSRKLLTSDQVVKAINYYTDRWENGSACGLCAAFNSAGLDGWDVNRLIIATGGVNHGGYYWARPYQRTPVAHAQRMTYLAFLLAWVENP